MVSLKSINSLIRKTQKKFMREEQHLGSSSLFFLLL